MHNDTVQRTLLLDFYGELLTDKQREYFDLHYNEDLSLAEIAEQTGISRQGVWDIIRRADTALRETEEKTGLVRRFQEMRTLVDSMEKDLAELLHLTDGSARLLTEGLLQKAAELKQETL